MSEKLAPITTLSKKQIELQAIGLEDARVKARHAQMQEFAGRVVSTALFAIKDYVPGQNRIPETGFRVLAGEPDKSLKLSLYERDNVRDTPQVAVWLAPTLNANTASQERIATFDPSDPPIVEVHPLTDDGERGSLDALNSTAGMEYAEKVASLVEETFGPNPKGQQAQ